MRERRDEHPPTRKVQGPAYFRPSKAPSTEAVGQFRSVLSTPVIRFGSGERRSANAVYDDDSSLLVHNNQYHRRLLK